MEKQAKELTQLIDEPINTIAKQVKDYEEEQKRRKRGNSCIHGRSVCRITGNSCL